MAIPATTEDASITISLDPAARPTPPIGTDDDADDPCDLAIEDRVSADGSRPALPDQTADGSDDRNEEVRHRAETVPSTIRETFMTETDNDRIAKIAHDLWEAEGRPHGRDQDHWDAATAIVGLRDKAGAASPVEESAAAVGKASDNVVAFASREPALKPEPAAKPEAPKKAAAKRVAAPNEPAKTEEVAAKRGKAPSRTKRK